MLQYACTSLSSNLRALSIDEEEIMAKEEEASETSSVESKYFYILAKFMEWSV